MSSTTHTPVQPTNSARSAGRVALFVAAIAMVVGGLTLLAGAGGLTGVDKTQRDDGYLTTDTTRVTAAGYAVASEGLELGGRDEEWVLGRARVRATATDGTPVFIGVARSDDAAAYLENIEHSTVTEIADPSTTFEQHSGGTPTVDPADSDIWITQASGSGTQSIDWSLDKAGRWTVVVMNADGSSDVDIDADAGATVPILHDVTVGLFATGALFVLIGGGVLVGLRVNRPRHAAEGELR